MARRQLRKPKRIARLQQNIDETLKILGLSHESRSRSCSSSNRDTSVSPSPRNSPSVGLGTPQRKQTKHSIHSHISVSGPWSSSESESYSPPPKCSSHNHCSPKRYPRKKLIKSPNPSSKNSQVCKPQKSCTSSTPIQDRSPPFNKTPAHTLRSSSNSPRNRRAGRETQTVTEVGAAATVGVLNLCQTLGQVLILLSKYHHQLNWSHWLPQGTLWDYPWRVFFLSTWGVSKLTCTSECH